MPRILIAECKQEVSTFNPHLSGCGDFGIRRGRELLDYHCGVRNEVGGALSVFDATEEIEVVPAYSAFFITSGGTLAKPDWEQIASEFLGEIQNAPPVDAVYFFQGQMVVGHVGDSRVYRVRDRRIEMVTEDHSLFNDWMRMKNLTPDDEVNFPLKNVVVRALGLHDQVQVDVLQEHYRVGDVFLMCSDGLCGMIKDSLILELILKYDRLDSCCSKLIDAANEAGGNDNITALIIRVEKL